MTGAANAIMRRVSAHSRGRWVCTPKDFLDLGSREAVDQALSRLVRPDGCAASAGVSTICRVSAPC